MNLFVCILALLWQTISSLDKKEGGVSKCDPKAGSIYQFMVETLDGRNESMIKYKGFTEQYRDFNPIVNKYANQGFYMAAFPCNQFDLQEPGENSEILNGVKYVRPGNGFTPATNLHIYGKLEVNGNNAHPMYKFLKDACPSTTNVLGKKQYMMWDVIRMNDIYWNFEKFIIDRNGRPLFRIHPASWDHGKFVTPYLDLVFSGSSNNNSNSSTMDDGNDSTIASELQLLDSYPTTATNGVSKNRPWFNIF